MCMICATIPATAAIGAKLNADQLPISKIIAGVMGLLVIASAIYRTLRWEN